MAEDVAVDTPIKVKEILIRNGKLYALLLSGQERPIYVFSKLLSNRKENIKFFDWWTEQEGRSQVEPFYPIEWSENLKTVAI